MNQGEIEFLLYSGWAVMEVLPQKVLGPSSMCLAIPTQVVLYVIAKVIGFAEFPLRLGLLQKLGLHQKLSEFI